ncbi:MAG: ester cyclase [Pseudomonadota bacterium]
MRSKFVKVALFLLPISAVAQVELTKEQQEVVNKALAKAFYEDLWNSNNTDQYGKYMAETYIAHDIGDRKGVEEPAIEQKNIADFFWNNGEMSVEYDYQVADGDLVATRWIWKYEPTTLFGKVFLSSPDIPIINVFRVEDGKIVELWNHRHDIDTSMTLRFKMQGFAAGVVLMLLPLLIMRARWKRKALAL